MEWVCICHGKCVQVRSQLCGVRSLFPLYLSSKDQAQVIRLAWLSGLSPPEPPRQPTAGLLPGGSHTLQLQSTLSGWSKAALSSDGNAVLTAHCAQCYLKHSGGISTFTPMLCNTPCCS